MVECCETECLRVLAVDDEESILKLYQDVLGQPSEVSDSTRKLADLSSKLFGDDNDELIQGSVELVLSRQGEDAVEKVREAVKQGTPFALVYMDMRLPPGRDGIWAAEQIRRIDPNVIIIIVTAFSDVKPEEIARRVPPLDKLLYVQKPIQPHGIRQYLTSMGTKWLNEKELRKFHALVGAEFGHKAVQLHSVKDDLEKEISARNSIEKAHIENELVIRLAMEACADVFFRFTPKSGTFDLFKGFLKRLMGFSDGELLEMAYDGFLRRIHPDDLPHYRQYVEGFSDDTCNGPRCRSMQYRWKHKDGGYIELNETRVLMYGSNAAPNYVLGVIRSKPQFTEVE